MRTQTRQEAAAALHQVGPFIIQRAARGRAPTFAAKTGGWVTERGKAWKFDTEAQARFTLRGRGGEIVPADGSDVRDRSVVPAVVRNGQQVPGALTLAERDTLAECEARIRQGLNLFLQVADALLMVRAERLYRQDYSTFEEYCRSRWNITPRRARQMCDGAEVVANIAETCGAVPTNERQTRALQGLPKEQQQLVWNEAVAGVPNGKAPTGKQVAEVVARRVPKIAGSQSPIVKAEGTDMPLIDAKFHVIDALVEARAARDDLGRVPNGHAGLELHSYKGLIYHAEKAADHLECLKTLLSTSGEVKTPKPKLSAAGRARLEAAAKARWAKVKARASA